MGDAFDTLHPCVRFLHSLQGLHRFDGEVAVDGPVNWLGTVVARLGQLPRGSERGRFAFDVHATPEREVWTRYFPSRTMRSVLSRDGAELVEKLGVFRLRFSLDSSHGRLRMILLGVSAFGLACPRWLFPTVAAEEHGDDDRFCFDVRMRMPLAGQVVRYHGYLLLAGRTER